jgi:hypothetical protein
MEILGFLADAAHVFQRNLLARTSFLSSPAEPDQAPAVDRQQTLPVDAGSEPVGDRYVPDSESAPGATPSEEQDSYIPASSDSENQEGESASPAIYSFKHQTHLRSKLTLGFDLSQFKAEIMQAVGRMEDGGEETADSLVSRLFSTSFRITSQLHLDARQITVLRGDNPDSASAAGIATDAAKLKLRDRVRGLFAAQTGDFAARGYFRQALKVRDQLQVDQRPGFTRTFQSLSLRAKQDFTFSAATFDRFTTQTAKLNDTEPESLPSYFSATDKLANQGSADMITTFLDTVDSYLGQAEENLLQNVQAFFDRAADMLGVSSDSLAAAEEVFTGTITGFFDRVEETIAAIASDMGATEPVPESETEVIETDVPEVSDSAIANDRKQEIPNQTVAA